jgi:hypothetical protein
MGEATVIILHPPPEGDGPLTTLLHDARDRLAERHARLFAAAGATSVVVDRRPTVATFGARLDEIAGSAQGGVALLGAGAVPLLRMADARRLVAAARGTGPVALTNSRHSSDVLAVGDAGLLRGLRGVLNDNVLPRRLAERGVAVAELPGRDRLAIDLDTPIDLALLALLPSCPRELRDLAAAADLRIPRLAEVRAVAADPAAELLVFGRSSSRTLTWLERETACRVRFLAEERGLRTAPATQRPARSTLGLLLAAHGPEALGSIVADLADGAILDTRVLTLGRGPIRLGSTAARRGRRPVATGPDVQRGRGRDTSRARGSLDRRAGTALAHRDTHDGGLLVTFRRTSAVAPARTRDARMTAGCW